jgi:hypothetical protein
MRASRQFDAATAHVTGKLEQYGLDEVRILRFPADGQTMFGTQKSRPAWNASFAELWEVGRVEGRPALAARESIGVVRRQL